MAMGMVVKRHRFTFEGEKYKVVVRKNVDDLSLYDAFLYYDDGGGYPLDECLEYRDINMLIKEIKSQYLGIDY